jgi:hypothetical protein
LWRKGEVISHTSPDRRLEHEDMKGKSPDLPFFFALSRDGNVTVKRVFLTCGVLALLSGGCHRPLDKPAGPVDVVVEGNRSLPSGITGRWKADADGWEFVLAPDGRIESAVISIGRVRVVPGRTTTATTKGGGDAIFAPGQWTVHYAPESGQLTVRIVMDRVRVEMGESTIEGSSTDVFAGPVNPQDGTWQTQWTTFARYIRHAPGKPPVDLSTDPTYGETKPLIFRKTADR